MDYLSNFRQSFTSLLTPRKSPLEQSQPQSNLPTPITTSTFSTSTIQPHTQSCEHTLQRRSMSPASKTQGWLSSASSSQHGRSVGQSKEALEKKLGKLGRSSPVKMGAMETPRESIGNFWQLPTPLTDGLKRKLGFARNYGCADSQLADNADYLDGDTLMVNEVTPAKRRRVTGDYGRTAAREVTGQVDEEGNTLEGNTLVADDAKSYAGSGSETEAEDSEMVDEESNFSDDAGVDERLSSDTSEADEEMVMIPPPICRASRGSRTPYNADDVYRPSPKIVDKNLAKGIVRGDEDSELSEDELVWKRHTLRKNDRKEVAFDFSMEKAKRWADAVKLPNGHWAEAEQDLFFRLAMRGFEPLVPSNWQLDFNTLPESLFSHPGGNAPFIDSAKGQEFRAIKALSDLFDLGNQVRDRQFVRLRPEPVIHRTINRYIRWALHDSNLLNRPNVIPVHAVYSLKPAESTRHAVQTLNRRLVTLGNRYREAWRLMPSIEASFTETSNRCSDNNNEAGQCSNSYASRSFPVLTGFLVCGPIVAVLTLDSDPKVHPVLDLNTPGKFISQFDFAEFGQDVWNAFAVAIAVIRMRKTMIQLEAEGREEPMWMIGDRKDSTDQDF
ncbi:hypothetical protein AJ79_03263 [Helicocarpus griseus UAMH5409]|uniref:Uncharacterized protein n=1 Tax=Helicocarpus griseus UAMH5409 TaxID=1447875 RepID=A0A2B7XYX4_9EURO|nr:hypothetical protein AJ79_03263 [Helicocarpus griseus UAMH5409]